jgi:undecaprenyl-diphosphatase
MSIARTRSRPAIVCASLSFVLFALLAFGVTSGSLMPIDNRIRSAVHGWTFGTLTNLAYDFSLLGSAAVLTSLFVIALTGFLLAGQRRAAGGMAAAMGGAIVLENALKYGFHRIRPQPFFGAAPETYSFPSGHALFSTCFFGVVAYLLAVNFRSAAPRAAVWTTAVMLVGLIGMSRIYLGVHYPSDVTGGILVAILWIATLRSLRLLRTGNAVEP